MNVALLIAFALSADVGFPGSDCRTPAAGLIWHRDQGQTVTLTAKDGMTRLWINPESGFYSVIRGAGPVAWCWQGDGWARGGGEA